MATTVTLKPNAIDLSGSTSGTTTLQATAVAGTTTITLPAATDTLDGKATTDTLTNKTLTAPVISTISNTGTLTLPTSTDTLVGRATTDTLTNKTLTSPTLTTPALGTPASGVMTNVTGINYDGYKNRIINGAMVIAQRGTGSTTNVAATNFYPVDRFYCYGDAASKFSGQQNAGSVTPPVGYINYLGITSLSAYSVPAGELYIINQPVEGLNITDLAWGTANAKTVTLSFQVYSSLTGTFGGALRNSAHNRSYPFSYSIPSANTWTTISITIAGDQSGTWLTTNGIGVEVDFGLGVGSTFSGTAGAWAGANYLSATGATSVVGTNGATFYITGVQLEKGSTATSFDYRPYGTELALCQRYYWKSLANNNVNQLCWASLTNQNSSTRLYGFFQYPVTMRTTPSALTINSISVALYYGSSGTNITAASIDSGTIGQNTAAIVFDTASSPATAGQVLILTSQGGGAGYVAFSAEL